VILEEDVSLGAAEIAFHGPLKRGANTRKAGEDDLGGGDLASRTGADPG